MFTSLDICSKIMTGLPLINFISIINFFQTSVAREVYKRKVIEHTNVWHESSVRFTQEFSTILKICSHFRVWKAMKKIKQKNLINFWRKRNAKKRSCLPCDLRKVLRNQSDQTVSKSTEISAFWSAKVLFHFLWHWHRI